MTPLYPRIIARMPASCRLAAVVAAALSVAAGPLFPRAGLAQTRAIEACSYDECALRVEPRVFGAPRIVRGTFGAPVASLGLFGADVERIVQGADSAVRHARVYRASQRWAVAATVAGFVLGSVAIAQCDDTGFIFPSCSGSAMPLAVGALAGTFYGAFEYRRANRALARAVWWYNRGLPR